MADSSEIEIEEYEELVGDLNYSTPNTSRSATPAAGAEIELDSPPFDVPISYTTTAETATSFQHIAHCSRSDPSSITKLAGALPVPRRPVAATLAPRTWGSNGTTDLSSQQTDRERRTVRLIIPTEGTDACPVSTTAEMQDLASHTTLVNQQQPDPVWMPELTAVTAKIDALMDAVYHGQITAAPVVDAIEKRPVRDARTDREEASRPIESTGRRLWQLDSDVQIDLDRTHVPRSNPELDLTILPRNPACADTHATLRKMPRQDPVMNDRPDGNCKPDRERPTADAGRSTNKLSIGRTETRTSRTQQPSQRPTDSLTSRGRQGDRSDRATQSSRPTSHSQTRPRPAAHRGRRDDSSPDNDSSDMDRRSSDRRRDNSRRRTSRRRNRSRRRGDTSPDSDNGGDGPTGGSSSEDDTAVQRHGRKQFRIKVQKFDGTSSWESWWAHFQNCASYNRWTERDQLAFVKGALTGNAAQVLWDTDRAATSSLKKLVAILKSRYSGERQAEKYRAELQIRRRRMHEGLSELHQDIRRLMALAYPKLTAEAREQIGCDHFTNALADPDFALKVKERSPKSLDEALCIALRLEAWAKSVKQDKQDDDRFDRSKQKVRFSGKTETAKPTNRPEASDRLAKLETQVGQLHEKLSRLMEVPQHPVLPTVVQPAPAVNSADQRPAGWTTASTGERQMPRNASENSHIQPTAVPHTFSRQTQLLICWECGLPGHIRRNCPMRNQASSGQPAANNSASRGSAKMQDQSNVYLKMSLLGKDVPCLVDTGCELTLVPYDLISRYRNIELRSTIRQVWAANNTPIRISGEVRLPFILEDRCLWTTALVSEDVEEVMLGIDWLKEYNCLWDFKTGNLCIDGQQAITLSRCSHIKCRRVLAQDRLEIPPRSQRDVTARITLLSIHDSMKDVIVETNQVKPGLYVGRTLLPSRHRGVKVCVANTTSEPQTIPAGSCLGQAVPVTIVTATETNPVSGPTTSSESYNPKTPLADIIGPTIEKLPADISAEQQQQVVELLKEYDDLFSRGTFDMGRTTLAEHSIDTGQHRPKRQALRRHPRAQLEEIDRQVTELQQNDFIEPAASPWSSNVVLVRKKDGSYRLCVDYRQLNSITYKDAYPLPHIDTCLGSMNGAAWFSTLDLRSGYHNIPIKQEDRDKTAFVTRRGCFRYKVMPFGLTCAPSAFQRLMDLVLCGLTYETCLVYLDDIIVFSRNFDSHLQRLREIFNRLKAASLKLHMKKCCLFQHRVSFLGHILTEEGIEVQPEKVAAVQNWPAPRNLTELRSFVGLCSYYRRFISGFASMAAPLHELTRKNVRFRWGAEQDEAFNRLKERLTTAPVLGMPRDEGTYYLDSDASDVGLGAVLSQDQDGQEVVLAYASRSLSRTERNYDVTRRELLAVVYGLKTYKQYLLGRQFVIRTDHSALQSLRRASEPIGQQARWQTFIEQFSFSIMHRPGTKHQNADALSRRPVAEDEITDERLKYCAATTSRPKVTDSRSTTADQGQTSAGETMSELQQEDSDIGPILRLRLRQSEQPRPEEVLRESEAVKVLWGQWHCLTVRNAVLYRIATEKKGRPAILQLVVPSAKRTEFIRRCHEGMTGGHRAFRSTLEQVRRRGYWPGWRREVQRFCRQCLPCSTYHRGRLPRSGPLHPMVTGTVMERCHVDTLVLIRRRQEVRGIS